MYHPRVVKGAPVFRNTSRTNRKATKKGSAVGSDTSRLSPLQVSALTVPDELTVTHLWKGAPREYNFDAVFAPGTPQEQVRVHRLLWGAEGAGAAQD